MGRSEPDTKAPLFERGPTQMVLTVLLTLELGGAYAPYIRARDPILLFVLVFGIAAPVVIGFALRPDDDDRS